MQKPSKKVISTMIIVGAIVVAFIGADKIKNDDFLSKDKQVSGEIKPVTPQKVKSIEEYMLDKIEENAQNDEYEEPKTVTEFALVEFFKNYNLLKQKSLDTPENTDSLTTELANKIKEFSTLPNKYKILDLQTFPDYQKDEAKNYGNDFAKTLEIYFKQSAILDDQDALTYVKKYSKIQENYSDNLSKLRVPRSISDEHLVFTNNIYKISVALPQLATIEDDPLLYALILEQYKSVLNENIEILKKISAYFELNDIIFSDDEPGAMWNNF